PTGPPRLQRSSGHCVEKNSVGSIASGPSSSASSVRTVGPPAGTAPRGKRGGHRWPPGGTIEVGEAARAVAADEPEDDAGPAVLGAVVEGRVDEAVGRERRAVQPPRAPEPVRGGRG